ncbi:hypothetical protein ACFWHF_14425 [Streptomyces griseoincarnatus]
MSNEVRITVTTTDHTGNAFQSLNMSLSGLQAHAGSAAAAIGTSGAAGGPGLSGALGGFAALVGASALPSLSAFIPLLAGGAVAAGTLKLGFAGVSDALAAAGKDQEAYQKALAGMSPAARSFTETLVGMKKEFAGVGREVQKAMLPGFTNALKAAKPLIDPVRSSLVEMGRAFGEVGNQFAKMFKDSGFQKDFSRVLEMGTESIGKLAKSIAPLVQSFIEFGAASKPALDALTNGLSDLLSKGLPGFFEGLSRGIEGSSKMFAGLFDALNVVLPAFGRLSGQLADTFGPLLGSIFRYIGELVAAVADALIPALDALSPVFDNLSKGIDGSIGPMRTLISVLGTALGWAAQIVAIALKNITDLMVILQPIVSNLASAIFGGLAPAFGSLDGKMGWAEKLSNFVASHKLELQQVFSLGAAAVMDFVIAVVENLPGAFTMFRTLLSVVLGVMGGILEAAATGLGWLPGIGDDIEDANEAFKGFRSTVEENLAKAGVYVEDFSGRVTPKLKQNKLEMNIRNWETQLGTAKEQLKTVPPSKRSKLLATIADLQEKIATGKASLASIKDKNVSVNGKNNTGAATGGAKRNLSSVRSRSVNLNARNLVGGAVSAAKRSIGSVVGKTVSIVANFVSTGAQKVKSFFGFAHGGIVGRAAEGGPRSNMTLVGEQGPELVNLAPGSTVHTNGDTARMLAGMASAGGGRPLDLSMYIDSHRFAELMIDPLRKVVAARGGNVQAVLGRA